MERRQADAGKTRFGTHGENYFRLKAMASLKIAPHEGVAEHSPSETGDKRPPGLQQVIQNDVQSVFPFVKGAKCFAKLKNRQDKGKSHKHKHRGICAKTCG